MRKPHDIRHAEIVQGALDVAAEKGLSSVTTQAIAERVGIAQPTIFRHFRSRDAIFRAAMEWIANALLKALEGISADLPADARLKRLLQRKLALVSKQRGVPRLLFSDRLHLEDPELKSTVRRIMDIYAKRLTVILEEGVRTGCFRNDLDTEQTARFIGALFQGLLMRWSIHDFEFPLEEEGETLWQFVWPAVAPR